MGFLLFPYMGMGLHLAAFGRRSSAIINIHSLKQTVLATKKLCLNPKQAVYLLIPISCPGHIEGIED